MAALIDCFSNTDRLSELLGAMGWSTGYDETDTVQQVVKDSRDNDVGILLCTSGEPSLFLRAPKGPLGDPEEVYQALLWGWNLEAWLTAVPAPRNVLRVYNTSYRPSKEFIIRGLERPVTEVNLEEVLDLEVAQQVAGKLLLLSPDTWRSQGYEEFLQSPTARQRLPVDNALLSDLQDWRLTLVRNLHERHPEVATDNLDALAQTLLDEIIFIRFCEDRELTAFERLFDIARSKEVVDRFQALVQEYEELFDTRLFDPDLTTNIRPSPSVLQAIIAQSVEFYKFDVLDVDLLGRIYEEYLSYELQHGQQGLFYEFQLERRKQLGIYYTPSYIVEYLVGRALHVFEEANGRPVRSVLDPACGSGAFLTELFEELVRRQNEAVTFVQKRTLLEETIYGIDVDHYAIRRAAQALCYTALTGESALAGHHLLPALVGENLIAKDSLLDRDQLIPGQQFDVIVSNPPYRRVTGEELEQYRNLYQDVIFGQPDLYCMMLVAALDNLIEGGVVAFVVPDNLLRTHHYAPVRQYILNKARIVEISFLNYQAFESTNLQTVFIVLQRESSEEVRKVSCIQVGYYSTPGVFERTAVDQIPQAGFYNPELDYAFNVQLTAPVRAVYEKIRDQSDMIEEHFNVSQGIKPNRETLYATPISESCEAYLFGKDIQPYSVNWSGSYIDYNLERAAEDPNVRLRDPDLFAVPVKLVMRKISGDRLVVAFDSKQYYADSSCYVLVPKGEVSQEIVYLMLALLNSRLTKFYYLVEYPDRKTIFPQIRVRDVNRLPFPNDDLLANETIVNSIVELVKSLRSDIASGQVSGSAAYQTSQAKQIERLLLNLYGLTEIDSALIDSYLEL